MHSKTDEKICVNNHETDSLYVSPYIPLGIPFFMGSGWQALSIATKGNMLISLPLGIISIKLCLDLAEKQYKEFYSPTFKPYQLGGYLYRATRLPNIAKKLYQKISDNKTSKENKDQSEKAIEKNIKESHSQVTKEKKVQSSANQKKDFEAKVFKAVEFKDKSNFF
jgi:hypothetical protein